MRTDSPQALMGALGNIEDEMADMQHWYSEAAGWMAEWEHEYRALFLAKRNELRELGHFDPKATETSIKNDVDYALQVEHEGRYQELKRQAHVKAAGDKLFSSLDARRSIGQTLMKPHLASESKFGQEAWGQSTTPEPA